MPGYRLMCVWQAVFARDVFPESGVKKATVKSVTEAMSILPLLDYKEATFEETFTTSKIEFGFYLGYVFDKLRRVGSPFHLMIESMEDACWDICEEAELYSSDHISQVEVKKLWQIFNRISIMDSYTPKGPIAAKEEINWIMDKVADNLGKSWKSHDSVSSEGMSFKEFLTLLEVTFFAAGQSVIIRQSIEDMHSWLVREVLKAGWLAKRTKKQSNWTNWLKRWFVLTPTGLQYFEAESCRVKKGEVVIDGKTTVESLPDFSSLTKKMKCRLKMSNRPQLEIELSAVSELDKQQWINNIEGCIESAKSGVTPMGKLIGDRASNRKIKKEDSLEKMDSEMTAKEAAARRGSRKMSDGTVQTKTSKAPGLGKVKELSLEMPAPPPLEDLTEEYDNNALEVQKDKIKVVFQNIDKDGNGKIDKVEFLGFVKGLGLAMDQKEADLIFNVVDGDDNGFICFVEFYDYFIKFVMGETASSDSEAKLRTAFLVADRDGSGAVSFREFAEYAMDKRRDLAMHRLLEAFEQLDVDNSGEITYKEFRKFFKEESSRSSIADLGMMSPSSASKMQPVLEDMLKGVYEKSDANDVATYLRQRWNKFASFRRAGASGDMVMTGGSGMVDDLVPGEYALIDLACFNDLPPIEPKHVVVKATWHKTNVPGKSGRIVFPTDFADKLPTEIATNATLAYYGCSLADGNQLKVSLLYRHGIQDFTYENNYLEEYVTAEDALGGAGLERHGFAHLDCPLDQNSGFFVIGKMVDDDLHLTGFKIPTRHTLYVPPFVVHCNDYLKGTWRTMLSDEAEIDHVQLVKQQRQGKIESYEHFQFSFEALVA